MEEETRISKLKKGIESEESQLREEVKKEGKGMSWFFKSHTFKILLAIVIFVALFFIIIYFANSQSMIYVENSGISAPVITLSPPTAGVLQEVFVKAGDFIPAGTTVAQVSGVAVKSQISGLVISVQNTPGQLVSSQSSVVQMIDPQELRLTGHVQEDKGLINIHAGQKVVFTVDAFGSKKYSGIVESVSPAPDTSDIVFSISNSRQEKQYTVTVKYDLSAYPDFSQGMSAKMWVYK